MLSEGVISLVLTVSLVSAQPERPLTVAVAAQAQAMDARMQVRPVAQTDPTAQPPKKEGMSRSKKIWITVGIVAGAALIWAALDSGDDNNTSGGGGGGY
jgi:hypothetical protein